MKITHILEQTAPMASDIRNAVIDFSQMTTSCVAVVTDVVVEGKPVIGYGFNSNGRYAQGGILRERMIPRLMKAAPEKLVTDDGRNLCPFKAQKVMMANEKPGGHGERCVAVGTVDMALWDAVAKIEGLPLYQLLANRYRSSPIEKKVYVYAAGGYYYPGKDLDGLRNEFRGYLDLGYEACKMKIGGATLKEDLSRIEAALEVVGDGRHLAVDANARFDVETALQYAEALKPYGLKWYEEPVDPLDFVGHEQVAQAYEGPIATGENLFSLSDARNLIRHGGLRCDRDVLQFDPALSYGLVEYLRVLEMLREQGWSPNSCIPHGGHQFALHIAAGLGLGGNESYPEVFQPFGGFADGSEIKDGYLTLPEVPGIGIELKSKLMAIFQKLVKSVV